MKKSSIHLSCFAFTLALTASAYAVTPKTADAVLLVVKGAPAISQSSTDFERWAADTLGFTASICWHSAYPNGRTPAVLDSRPHRSGTFQAPEGDEAERLCTSLATHGFRPWCVTASVWGDQRQPDPALPRDYLQFERYAERPPVRGGLYCHVTQDIIQQQFFVPDELAARWSQPPQRSNFTLPKGGHLLNAGTVIIEVPTARDQSGRPFSIPVIGIVPN